MNNKGEREGRACGKCIYFKPFPVQPRTEFDNDEYYDERKYDFLEGIHGSCDHPHGYGGWTIKYHGDWCPKWVPDMSKL